MTRIGLFGGTFAPFHNGHREGLETFLKKGKLDRCIVMPAGIPPHKKKPDAFTDEQRMDLTRLACVGLPCEVSRWEIAHPELSYTYRTLEYLSGQYPDAQLVLFVGSDMFLSFHTWKEPQKILDRAELFVLTRTGTDNAELEAQKRKLETEYRNVRIAIHDHIPVVISSSQIREGLENGGNADGLIPEHAAAYLRRLRGEPPFDPAQYETCLSLLRSRLSEYRLRHCLGVMKEAELLARLHGYDPEKAAFAGLMHDMTKEFSKQEHFALFDEYGFVPDPVLRENRNLWHAVSGSFDLRKTLRVTDPEILSAVRYHTTGHAGMSELDVILYIADLVDETRTYYDVAFYREEAREDPYKAAALAMEWCIGDLKANGIPVHPDMPAAAAELRARCPDITLFAEKERLCYPTDEPPADAKRR